MRNWENTTNDETQTDRLGAALAQFLFPGAVVALEGQLGAGKTRLVQAVAAALGADRSLVVSPTFVLIHEYPARLPIYHFDAYRLTTAEQFAELGVEEYFGGRGVCFIEWADKVRACLPAEHLQIRIDVTGPTSRRFDFLPHGTVYETLLQHLPAQNEISDASAKRR